MMMAFSTPAELLQMINAHSLLRCQKIDTVLQM